MDISGKLVDIRGQLVDISGRLVDIRGRSINAQPADRALFRGCRATCAKPQPIDLHLFGTTNVQSWTTHVH